jgi:micrococcal nuclease
MKPQHCALILMLLSAVPTFAQPWSGKCVGIADGDTITVMHAGRPEKIRLYGIDCPEERQPFGTRAKLFTSAASFGATVEIRPVTTDRYGRTVAWVSVNGVNVNHEILSAGLAWWYRKYAPNDSELEQLELQAQKGRRGLWSQENPVPPWEWRRAKKQRSRHGKE